MFETSIIIGTFHHSEGVGRWLDGPGSGARRQHKREVEVRWKNAQAEGQRRVRPATRQLIRSDQLSHTYAALESAALLLHLCWILWILFGWTQTRGRPTLAWVHILSLVWGIAVELGPWPCPLTLVEQWLEARSGATPSNQGFLVHYLDRLVYPDLPEAVVGWTATAICIAILCIYYIRVRRGKFIQL
jgi:hypothetical protein